MSEVAQFFGLAADGAPKLREIPKEPKRQSFLTNLDRSSRNQMVTRQKQ